MVTEYDFDAALSTLLAWVGQPVAVGIGAADGEPPLVGAYSGVLARADELSGDAASSTEDLYFPFAGAEGAGFFLRRSAFRGAEWNGAVLRIVLGVLVLTVERVD